MGRVRSRATLKLPDNLYPNREGYKYRRPTDRKEFWMGSDLRQACAEARELNDLLYSSSNRVNRIMGEDRTVSDALALFRKDDMPNRSWSANTAKEHEARLKRINMDIGGHALSGFNVREAADFLRSVTSSERNRQIYRLLMIWIFRGCLQEGWVDSNPLNPFEVTRKGQAKRKRARLTKDTFDRIRAHAPSWLQNAMDLSLITLLRREDIVSAKFDDVREGFLWVIPSKTENSTNVQLKFRMTPPIQALVAQCGDGIESPYIIHRTPERRKSAAEKSVHRLHHTQVLPEQVTRAFDDARQAAGIDEQYPPTFHEIRSLGGWLYQQGGRELKDLQALMGHGSEEMTLLYLKGHEAVWTEVDPSYSLKK